ncbi:MAG: DUF6603 domain-containing protein, partial [Candidatus Dormibacteria bacterium]
TPAGNTTVWRTLSRSIGPLQLERAGLRFADDTLYLLLDASIQAGPLTLGLAGLGAGVALADYTPAFTLDGLDVAFSSGAVELGGALIARAATDANGNPIEEYAGGLVVTAGAYTIAAVGAYAQDQGDPSFFAYAELTSPPLGGPAFFFVTGLAGGLGYNRRLRLPTVDEVKSFPLVQAISPGDSAPIARAGADPLAKLAAFGDWVSASPGDFWLAAGVRFTSFEMIQSTAVLAVAVGPRTRVSLTGLSEMSIPSGAEDPIAHAEVALAATLDPADGVLRVDAKLTPASYVLSRAARLTGGFAFYAWFGSGDFVVTYGGYHPQFDKPASYPDVPRLGLSW